jgi:hypothetical protein
MDIMIKATWNVNGQKISNARSNFESIEEAMGLMGELAGKPECVFAVLTVDGKVISTQVAR